MLILPYIHKVTKHNDLNIHIIRILTIGGKTIWEEDDSLDLETEVLLPNDIYCSSKLVKSNNLFLVEVDIEKTNMNNMYKWSEIDINDNETFCWRDYIYIVGNKNENWLNISENEKLSNVNLRHVILTILENHD
jgi:hypothetical protein